MKSQTIQHFSMLIDSMIFQKQESESQILIKFAPLIKEFPIPVVCSQFNFNVFQFFIANSILCQSDVILIEKLPFQIFALEISSEKNWKLVLQKHFE